MASKFDHGKEPPRMESFRVWLEGEGFSSERTIGDVVSRVKRVWSMIDLSSPKSDAELVFRLSERPEFRECSLSVRSQLKRSARLYRKFLERS